MNKETYYPSQIGLFDGWKFDSWINLSTVTKMGFFYPYYLEDHPIW